MAEALLIERVRARGKKTRVESAGIGALVDSPAHEVALELLRERGIDFSQHRGRQLTAAMANSFELILVMEEGQQKAIESRYPTARGRVHRLGRIGQFDIADPYKRDRAAFERSLELIERGLDEMSHLLIGKAS